MSSGTGSADMFDAKSQRPFCFTNTWEDVSFASTLGVFLPLK